MKQIPALYNAPMVSALLEGRKTQTRRIAKLPHMNPLGQWEPITIGGEHGGCTKAGDTIPLQGAIWHTRTGDCFMCPYGQPGDQLWVRETFAYVGPGSGSDLPIYIEERAKPEHQKPENCWYRASRPDEQIVWTPSIHMPRWASRITLEVTDIRVERLNDISEEDAIAEGVFKKTGVHVLGDLVETWDGRGEMIYVNPSQARNEYRYLWESINGPESWIQNPMAWVVSFKVLEVRG